MPLVAGIDVGGTKILGVVVDRDDPARILAQHRVDTPHSGEPDDLFDAMEAVASGLRPEVEAVGLGIAGLIDREGVMHLAPHLPALHGKPIRAELEKRLELSVTVENDVTCAAWGEHRVGAARGVSDSVCVAIGTGIGAGLVAGGQVERGAHGFAGEAGHMLIDPAGPVCPCGKRGCWERLASGSGLGRMARDAAEAGQLSRVLELAGGELAKVRGEHVSQAAHEGDGQALELLGSFAWWVAAGIANLVTLLDPSVVVIAGGLVEIGSPLLDPVRAHYQGLVMFGEARPDTRIVPAELGERAGAIGAALLA